MVNEKWRKRLAKEWSEEKEKKRWEDGMQVYSAKRSKKKQVAFLCEAEAKAIDEEL